MEITPKNQEAWINSVVKNHKLISELKIEKNMIKSNELRIGNYLTYKDGIDYRVLGINEAGGVYVEGFKGCLVLEVQFKPIPLTEEWLSRFGCQRVRMGWFLYSANYMLYNPLNSNDVRSSEYYALMYNERIVSTVAIRYVHQLQNLYFALNGEELTIKQAIENL
jgi:hypothetical protein